MTPGDVVIVEFLGAAGMKRRPAVVVSSDAYHAARLDVILGVITSNVGAATTSTDYVIQDWTSAGLRQESAFRSYFGTYDRNRVGPVIGRLSAADLSAVKDRLRAAFDI